MHLVYILLLFLDVVKVCCKPKHEVSNTTLIVTPMFFTEEADYGIYDASRHFVPLPSYFLLLEVDKHVQTFLRQSISVLEELNTCLSPKFAKVVIAEEIKVECTLSQKTPKARDIAKVWETEARKMVNKCIKKMIYKSEIIVTEDAWSEVENITSQQKLDTDTILTIYEKMNLKILFVGEKTSVQSFHTAISEQYKEIEHQILRKKRVKAEEIYHSVSKVKLLKKSGIIEEINKITDDLKVELDFRNGKILCTGVKENILQAKLKIMETVSKFEIWRISESLSMSQIRLLTREPVKSTLEMRFLENKLTVEVEFGDDSITIYTLDDSNKDQINSILKAMTEESEIPLDAIAAFIVSTNEWKLELLAINKQYKDKVRIVTEDDAKIVITSTSDLHGIIRERVENFFKNDTAIYNDTIEMTDAGIVKFVSKYCIGRLQEILVKHNQSLVTLEIQSNRIAMSGPSKGLVIIKLDIESMIQGIISTEKIYRYPGICKILTKDKPKLTDIEDTCRTVIMFPDHPNMDPPGRDRIVSSQNICCRTNIVLFLSIVVYRMTLTMPVLLL